jgi:hypothetical protein
MQHVLDLGAIAEAMHSGGHQSRRVAIVKFAQGIALACGDAINKALIVDFVTHNHLSIKG